MKRAVLLPVLLVIGSVLWAQDGGGGNIPWIFRDAIPGGHRGKVTSISYDGRRLLSAGEDGFLGVWDLEQGQAVMRFQISSLPILAMVRRPGKSQIAFIEDDGLGRRRISAWDYLSLERLFTLPFEDPLQGLSYSAGGAYLAVSCSGGTGVVLVDPETGTLLIKPRNMPEEFPLSAAFAAIGRTEKALLVYSPSGTLSYWELRGGRELNLAPAKDEFGLPLNFDAPMDLNSPLLFGNNRYLAGFDGGGLVVLGADTGYELDRDPAISGGILAVRGDELYCLAAAGKGGAGKPLPAGREGIYRFEMDAFDKLRQRGFYPSPAGMSIGALAVIPGEGAHSPPRIAVGTGDGELLRLDLESPPSPPARLRTNKQLRLPDAAAGTGDIAFLTGENSLGRIPLNFLDLKDGFPLVLENCGAYTRITAGGISPSWSGDGPGTDRFILWQDGSPLPYPALHGPRSPEAGLDLLLLNRPPRRGGNAGRSSAGPFSLRSVAVLDDQGLFLDLGGNVSVFSLANGEARYTETSAGSLDAAFVSRDSIILGRASSGDPFLMIDTLTRETVALPYPAFIGAQVYRGPSGTIYGTAVEESGGKRRTSLIRLNFQDPAGSERIAEYPGENMELSIAEAEGFAASTLGEGGIHRPWGAGGFERGPALPRRITGGGPRFIVLDTEGGISWYDSQNGELLAIFRIFEGEWNLGIAGSAPRRGPVRGIAE
ncbi:MAG: hypothetical protein LBH51_05545 [Treponema sp.]|nr:hypothetical protein [Treponema sp.]